MNGDDVWRAANGVAALIALVLFLRSAIRAWPRLTVRTRFYAQVIAVFLAASAWGSVENIVQANPIGFRTALTTTAILWTLYAVLFTDEVLEKPKAP